VCVANPQEIERLATKRKLLGPLGAAAEPILQSGAADVQAWEDMIRCVYVCCACVYVCVWEDVIRCVCM